MIIQNGYIRLATHTGGGVDTIGVPTATTLVWSAYIPCQWTYESISLLSRDENGNAVVSSAYNVLIEQADIDGEIAELSNMSKSVICERSIISKVNMSAVGKTQIRL